MKQFHINQLARLPKILKRVDDAHLTTEVWATDAANIRERRPKTCGTVACMLGWAGLDPSFRRRGLRTDPKRCEVNLVEDGTVQESNSIRVAATFFGLDYETASELFCYSRDYGDGHSARETFLTRLAGLFSRLREARPDLKVPKLRSPLDIPEAGEEFFKGATLRRPVTA